MNTENTQVLEEYGQGGVLKNTHIYGNERISTDVTATSDSIIHTITGVPTVRDDDVRPGTVLRQTQSGGHRTVSLSDTSTAYDLTYLYDGRGSVTQTVTDNIVTETFSYDPFGNTTTKVSRSDNYYGYNAEETNSITGLQYLRARYYSPDTGRFISADTYLGDLTNPLSHNRYSYTENNPVNYTDPTGHAPASIFSVLGGLNAPVTKRQGYNAFKKEYQYAPAVKKTTNNTTRRTTTNYSPRNSLFNTYIQPKVQSARKTNAKSSTIIKRDVETKLKAFTSGMIGIGMAMSAISGGGTSAVSLAGVGAALNRIKKKYCGDAEKISVNNENGKIFSTALKKDYGGNQGGALSTHGEERKKIMDIIHKYYPNMSDSEADNFLTKLNSEGCGYVALANTIFVRYADAPEEFEKIFGYNMYAGKGDSQDYRVNFNYLIVDLYAATDNHNQKGILWWKNDWIDEKEDISNVRGYGTTSDSRKYRFEKFMTDHGVDAKVQNTEGFWIFQNPIEANVDNYNKYSAQNGQMIVSQKPVMLYDSKNNLVFESEGGHAMTVTGTTSEGYLKVSSWGREYYLNPNDSTKKSMQVIKFYN